MVGEVVALGGGRPRARGRCACATTGTTGGDQPCLPRAQAPAHSRQRAAVHRRRTTCEAWAQLQAEEDDDASTATKNMATKIIMQAVRALYAPGYMQTEHLTIRPRPHL